MKMTAIPHSSNVQAAGYNDETGELHVTFRSGATYAYPVDRRVYEELLNHSSPGSFIRGHKGTRVEQ
jgi:hypothetical protein